LDGSADGNAAGSDLSSDFHHWIARILGYFGFFALCGAEGANFMRAVDKFGHFDTYASSKHFFHFKNKSHRDRRIAQNVPRFLSRV